MLGTVGLGSGALHDLKNVTVHRVKEARSPGLHGVADVLRSECETQQTLTSFVSRLRLLIWAQWEQKCKGVCS